ncbi:MAG: helix-turn-helix domain-containing protein [Nevskiaceae bacterium]|nr:MAG: helix-turn-helix domain-containing protein [Nevskiaceae bacterium]TBR73359.1 MAG: helix-turn-helix domain-containing protein [Nevskiaceae bacterium]
MTKLLSTTGVRPRERLAYWVDLICEAYVGLDCDARGDAPGFKGEIAVNSFADMRLTRASSVAQRVLRTPARIADSTEDYFLASFQTAGTCTIMQDGRVAHLAPGDFTLFTTTRPYELRYGGLFQQHFLMLPGPVLRTALRDTENLTATTVHGDRGAGRLMVSMIRTLAANIDTLEPESTTAVADAITQILIASLVSLPAARQPVPSHFAAFHRAQIKACVRALLRDPNLSIGHIAARLHVSPSTLHRAWAGEACSLADWIREQRLNTAQRDLGDSALAARSVSEIAFSWGFNNAAHFSRAFRTRFGCSPRDTRPPRPQ